MYHCFQRLAEVLYIPQELQSEEEEEDEEAVFDATGAETGAGAEYE